MQYTSITYVDNLEIPFITNASVRAVKEWLLKMEKQAVSIDFTRQTASDYHPENTSDCDIYPATEFTFDQCGFINDQLALAKNICEKFGYRFYRALGYLPAPDDFYLEVYPMINVDDGSTLCTKEHESDPDFYDVMLRTEILDSDQTYQVYYELENIPPKHINSVINAACKRFKCDHETICV